MQKRGQVAIFFIVGIIIVILVGLIFVGRKEFGVGVPAVKFLQSKLDPVKADLDNCIKKSTDTTVKKFLQQGGDLNPLKYVLYQNRRVKYLCYNIVDNDKCLNMMPSISTVVNGLQTQMDADIKNCVNRNLINGGLGYEITVNSEPKTTVKLEGESIRVDVEYDISVIKGESTEKLSKVTKKLDVPIIELYNVAADVVNAQAKEGFFEQLFYMLNKKGKYIIKVDKSPSAGNVGDIVYKINKNGNKFELWFAVEGE